MRSRSIAMDIATSSGEMKDLARARNGDTFRGQIARPCELAGKARGCRDAASDVDLHHLRLAVSGKLFKSRR